MPAIYSHTCAACAVAFTALQKTRKCCSVGCNAKANAVRFNRDTPVTCQHCGKTVMREPRKARLFSKYCSQECSWAVQKKHAAERTERLNAERPENFSKIYFCQCRICSKIFVARTKNAGICSYECNLERGRRYGRANHVPKLRVKHNKTCKECGKPYQTTCARSVYCSKKCMKRPDRRLWAARRRAKAKHFDLRAEKVTFQAVWDRDGGRCHICGELCFRKYKNGDPLLPTLEHKHPVSKGGSHLMENAGIAHMVCNSIKGTCTDPGEYVWRCKLAVKAAQAGQDPWIYKRSKAVVAA